MFGYLTRYRYLCDPIREKMKRKVEFAPVNLQGVADIYSVRVGAEADSEFRKFLILYKSATDHYIQDDFNRIVEAIKKVSEQGALERFFRPEGKMVDRVWAIPEEILSRNKKKHGTLRLYCIRVSDKLLIIGGGGVKATDTYEQDPLLNEAVSLLQAVDRELMSLEDDGTCIEDNIQNITVYID